MLTEKIDLIMGCFHSAISHFEGWLKEQDEAEPVRNLLVQKANHSKNKLEVYGAMVPVRILGTMTPMTVNSCEFYPYGHKVEIATIEDEESEFLDIDQSECGDDEDLINSLQRGCGQHI